MKFLFCKEFQPKPVRFLDPFSTRLQNGFVKFQEVFIKFEIQRKTGSLDSKKLVSTKDQNIIFKITVASVLIFRNKNFFKSKFLILFRDIFLKPKNDLLIVY